MFKKIFGNKKIVLIFDIIFLILTIFCYVYIYEVEKVKAVFVSDAITFVEENKNPVFRISKIVLYSSAHAVDNSEGGNLENIDISQFTDIAVYIDNKVKLEELTEENTINQLYIDNISLKTNDSKGNLILNYKNPAMFGKFIDLQNYEDQGIVFKVPHTNEEQIEAGFEESVFFTDCSNPISLGFVNKNLLTNCQIGNTNVNGSILFDGSILRNANIDLDNISGDIRFSINIKNNLDEDFICNVDIKHNFEDTENSIYSGYIMKVLNTEGAKYDFLKVSR